MTNLGSLFSLKSWTEGEKEYLIKNESLKNGKSWIKFSKKHQNVQKMLHERREKICLKFAQKCLKNPKTKDWFPLNVKSHQMITRKTEKYKVQNAKTERFRKSPITYMQHLLNEFED